MTTAISKAEAIEQVIAQGNLAALNPEQRTEYYQRLCDSLGLNPLTRPFEYLTLSGKLTLYARKDATEQLRNLRNVSISIVARETINDCYVVTARATTAEGRTDESIGAVSIANLKGDALCNAIMKSETKAKRRVTLSICGLGILDETELDTIAELKQQQPAAPQSMAAIAAVLPAALPPAAGSDDKEPMYRTIGEIKSLAWKYANVRTKSEWQAFIQAHLELEEYYEGCLEHASDAQRDKILGLLRDLKSAAEE